MKKLILAIETSCDETSIAILENDLILSNIVSSQIDTHAQYGGVMPEIASRMHAEQITVVLDEALKKANISLKDIHAFAVTAGPGLIGALHVGLQAAKTLAIIYEKPLIAVHHLAGHIYANQLTTQLQYPLLALIVSGGHSELVYMKQPLHFEIIGQTCDDAIGEAYDKVARIMGLGYPGGPIIDRLAKNGTPSYQLPKPKVQGEFDFSFSGLKTAVINLVHKESQNNQEIRKEDLASSFQTIAIEMVIEKTLLAIKKFPVKQVVLAGGVSANSYLRQEIVTRVQRLHSNIQVVLPPIWSCTDNAAMIGIVASMMYDEKIFAPIEVSAHPTWSISEALKYPQNK